MVNPVSATTSNFLRGVSAAPKPATGEDAESREAFQKFVGQTFFGQLLQQMRKTTGDNPYFNGGQAEKMFTAQLDQVLAEKLSDASAASFADPMYDLFMLNRR